jgi:hypothetical protein
MDTSAYRNFAKSPRDPWIFYIQGRSSNDSLMFFTPKIHTLANPPFFVDFSPTAYHKLLSQE